MWHTGLVAPRHVGSSQTRARTHVPCIGRRVPNHCAAKEAPAHLHFCSPFRKSYGSPCVRAVCPQSLSAPGGKASPAAGVQWSQLALCAPITPGIQVLSPYLLTSSFCVLKSEPKHKKSHKSLIFWFLLKPIFFHYSCT